MDISYTAPLRRAWDRMKSMLFRPFRLETWIVVGFSAFLTHLFTGHNSSFWGYHRSWNSDRMFPRAEHLAAGVQEHVLHWLENPFILMAIFAGLVLFAVVALLLAYVSARSHFVFLENVVTGRPEFLAPWGRHGRLGRSLFLWQAAFSFTWLVPAAIVLVPLAGVVRSEFLGGWVRWPSLIALIPMFALAGLIAIVLGFFLHMTDEFIVPIMYRHQEPASAAWRRFWPLFTEHLGQFFAYAIFMFVLALLALVTVLVAGVATCCVGLLLAAIPYVGTVVLLPLYVTWRALGPEFLAQFGPEWNVFATAGTPAAAAPAVPPATPAPPAL